MTLFKYNPSANDVYAPSGYPIRNYKIIDDKTYTVPTLK